MRMIWIRYLKFIAIYWQLFFLNNGMFLWSTVSQKTYYYAKKILRQNYIRVRHGNVKIEPWAFELPRSNVFRFQQNISELRFLYTLCLKYTHTHTHTHIYIHTHTHIYIYIHIHTHTHTHTHIYIYIYTHTHTHTSNVIRLKLKTILRGGESFSGVSC